MGEQDGQDKRREALPPLPMPLRWGIGVGIAILAGWFIWSLLPGAGFSTDLQRIGSGQPVVVLVHETANPTSMEVMERLEPLRADPPGGVAFLVASLGDPAGQQFARRYGAGNPGSLLFFDAAGEPREMLHAPDSRSEIEQVASRLGKR